MIRQNRQEPPPMHFEDGQDIDFFVLFKTFLW